MSKLISAVARFRDWATTSSPDRGPEWECEYENWDDLYIAVLSLVDERSFEYWSDEEIGAVLYALARDNEMQHITEEIRTRNATTLIALSRAAVEIGELEAKWQLAEELGRLEQAGAETVELLLTLARDDDEYVRRRSFAALARLGSADLEELALAEWHQPGDNQQWTRMNILWCLHRTGSHYLEPLLVEAEQDNRPLLSNFAKLVRQGEVDP